MRIQKVKRLVYSKLGSSEVIYGDVEYDGDLSDDNILNSVHEVGKTEWRPSAWKGPGDSWEKELWLLKSDLNNPNVKYPVYRIHVETFYKCEKTWYDSMIDKIKRILRI